MRESERSQFLVSGSVILVSLYLSLLGTFEHGLTSHCDWFNFRGYPENLPKCVYVKLDRDPCVNGVTIDLIPPFPCVAHAESGAQQGCSDCRFFHDVAALPPVQNLNPWPIDVKLDHCTEAVRLKIKQQPYLGGYLMSGKLFTRPLTVFRACHRHL